MCDLNGPFKLCTCKGAIDYTKPHWVLKTQANWNGQSISVLGMMSSDIYLIDEIKKKNIQKRLNRSNVFDFDYTPKENDTLFLYENEEEWIEFNFNQGRWEAKEVLGAFKELEYQNLRSGNIKSKTSKLTQVYNEYLDGLSEGEIDITCVSRWGNQNFSEQELIEILRAKIDGKEIELPKRYRSD